MAVAIAGSPAKHTTISYPSNEAQGIGIRFLTIQAASVFPTVINLSAVSISPLSILHGFARL